MVCSGFRVGGLEILPIWKNLNLPPRAQKRRGAAHRPRELPVLVALFEVRGNLITARGSVVWTFHIPKEHFSILATQRAPMYFAHHTWCSHLVFIQAFDLVGAWAQILGVEFVPHCGVHLQ